MLWFENYYCLLTKYPNWRYIDGIASIMERVRSLICILALGIDVITIFITWTLLVMAAHADPQSLLQNGDFQIESFVFNVNPIMDVISTGINTLIPFWATVQGGVQLLDTKVFMKPAGFNGTYIVHVNYRMGPGLLVSMPMYTMREGAVYTISLFMADNPDGGPVAKALRLIFTNVNGKRVGPELSPFVVSNSSTTRSSIVWQMVYCNVRGTGLPASLSLQSLTPGSFGPLVANIQVTLSTLVENGSFEQISPNINLSNVTYFATLSSPSTLINQWTVEVGTVKIASATRYQAATDNSATMLDLNALNSPATIGTTIPAKSSTDYVILFDTAINPEQVQSIQGQIVVTVDGISSGINLLTKAVNLDSTGYSVDSVGWNTVEFPFKTSKEDFQVKITFRSKVPGSFGPLLDNVAVYEVTKALKDTNETLSTVPPTVISHAYLNPYIPARGSVMRLTLFLMIFHSLFF